MLAKTYTEGPITHKSLILRLGAGNENRTRIASVAPAGLPFHRFRAHLSIAAGAIGKGTAVDG